MPVPKVSNPTGRNTQAYVATFGAHRFYFSYSTLVGYEGPAGSCRAENVWSRTTGRHINEMGLRDLEVVDESELRRRASFALTKHIPRPFWDQLDDLLSDAFRARTPDQQASIRRRFANLKGTHEG